MQHGRWLAGLLVLLGVTSGCAVRQTTPAPTGTLEKVKATRTIPRRGLRWALPGA